MKKHILTKVIGIIGILGSMALSGCGGGGGGGGGASRQVTGLFLFGTMSSNSVITGVTTSINLPNFRDYTTSTTTSANARDLRSGVLVPSSKATLSGARYDTVLKNLTITLTFDNMSSSTTNNAGKGNVIATLQTTPGTIFPASDNSPTVGYLRSSPVSIGYLNGCKVNYAP